MVAGLKSNHPGMSSGDEKWCQISTIGNNIASTPKLSERVTHYLRHRGHVHRYAITLA